MGVVGKMAMGLFMAFSVIATTMAQQAPVHTWHSAGLPPGAIGSRRLEQGGPVPGFFQPVEIKAPDGVLISLAEDGRFTPPQPTPVGVGLLIGSVYRLSAFNLPFRSGVEVYPTIEVIDRLYAPIGQETRFPIQIELTRDDLEQSANGKFITRVIYVENPAFALPTQGNRQQPSWFDIAPGQDPLMVADSLGRPVAIVRIGGRVPERADAPDAAFCSAAPRC